VVAAETDLADRATRHSPAGLDIHYLHFLVRKIGADAGNAAFQAVFPGRQVREGRGLRLAIADQDLRAVHVLHHPLYQGWRTGGTRHDAGAQCRKVVNTELWQFQFGNKHGGHTVDSGAALGLHRPQHRGGVEMFAGDHDAGAD
jgi:hypothetical protein